MIQVYDFEDSLSAAAEFFYELLTENADLKEEIKELEQIIEDLDEDSE